MSRRAALLVAFGFAFVYLYPFPYFGRLRSANELPRVLQTQEIVERGAFRIDARLGELGSRFDVSVTPDGRHYPNKAPGLSLLAVPGYLALKGVHALVGGTPSLATSTWLFRVTVVTLPSLLFLAVFVRVARRFSSSEAARRAALVAYALGSMALVYGLLFMSHQTGAVCVAGAFALAVALSRGEARRPDVTAVAVGALAGLSIVVDYQSFLGAAVVGIYLLLRAPRRWRHAALAAVGALPFLGVLLLYHRTCFGSPWTTPYSFAPDPAHRVGFLGMAGPNARSFYDALVSPASGLLVLSPWVVMALVGAVAIARDARARARVGAEALAAGAIVILYVVSLGSLLPQFARGGWQVGPRYIVATLPFVAWLAAAGFEAVDGRPTLRALSRGLVLVGVVVYVAAATTYPHWPTAFRHPLYEVTFRAIAEGRAPHSLGTWLGLRGLASIIPLYVAAGGLAFFLLVGPHETGSRDTARGGGSSPSPSRLWTSAGAVLVCVAVIAAYSAFPRTEPPAYREEKWGYVRSTWEP